MARSAPHIHSYHCLCTTLVLASTHKLSTLPRRVAPSLDNAVILPLPPKPVGDDDGAVPLSEHGYTVLVGLEKEGRPAVVRREDGFEKRWLWKCERCALVIGYELDEEHFVREGDTEKGKGREKDRTRVLYVLPGGVVSTETMAAGKKISETQVGLGQGGMTTAAFES